MKRLLLLIAAWGSLQTGAQAGVDLAILRARTPLN